MTQAARAPSRLLKCWGDEAVVYDAESGDTHYLKPLTLTVYQVCRDHPGCHVTALVALIAERLGMENTPPLHDLVSETLDGLRKAGLLESE